MNKWLKWTFASLVALMTIAVLAGCVSVSNETLADNITSQIRTKNVVFIDDATIDEESLVKDIDRGGSELYANSTIVVVDSDDLSNYEPQELSDYILNENSTKNGTINILVVNNEESSQLYVSAVLPVIQEKVESQLGKSGSDDSVVSERPGWLLINNIEQIKEIQSNNDGHVPMSKVFMWIGVGVIGLIVAIVLLVVIENIRIKTRKKRVLRNIARNDKRKRKEAEREAKRRRKMRRERAAKSATVDETLENYVKILANKSVKLRDDDPNLSASIENVLERFTQLREAITLMETPEHRKNMLYIGLKGRFESLVTLVGPKYYEDFKAHPDHWSNPQEKMKSIPLAFRAMDEKLLENIRQLKEGSEFDFEVALDKIVGFNIDPSSMLK